MAVTSGTPEADDGADEVRGGVDVDVDVVTRPRPAMDEDEDEDDADTTRAGACNAAIVTGMIGPALLLPFDFALLDVSIFFSSCNFCFCIISLCPE